MSRPYATAYLAGIASGLAACGIGLLWLGYWLARRP